MVLRASTDRRNARYHIDVKSWYPLMDDDVDRDDSQASTANAATQRLFFRLALLAVTSVCATATRFTDLAVSQWIPVLQRDTAGYVSVNDVCAAARRMVQSEKLEGRSENEVTLPSYIDPSVCDGNDDTGHGEGAASARVVVCPWSRLAPWDVYDNDDDCEPVIVGDRFLPCPEHGHEYAKLTTDRLICGEHDFALGLVLVLRCRITALSWSQS